MKLRCVIERITCQNPENGYSVMKVKVKDAMSAMIEAENLIKDGKAIYLPPFYHSEAGTCRRLLSVMAVQERSFFEGEPDIAAIEANSGIHYDQIQADAIRTAVSSKVMVLTGGPGRGPLVTFRCLPLCTGENDTLTIITD